MKKRSWFLLVLLVSTVLVWAEDDAFVSGMKKGMNLHEIATNKDTEMEAVEQFKTVARAYPDRWEAPYWASFVQTQAAMGVSDIAEVFALIEDCRRLYDTAWKLKGEKSSRDLVDFHTLESLINGFASGTYFREGNTKKGIEAAKLASQALNKATRADPDHPRVLVLIGTDLISDGTRTKDAKLVVAGRAVLQKARQRFAEFETESPVAPDWSRGWIDFWLQNRSDLPD